MSTAALLALLAAADASSALTGSDLTVRPEPRAGGTSCAACHTTADWREVSFAHERTGFPLTGRHRSVACEACHAGGSFTRAVARACVACHRDVHLGRMGGRCDGCHDTADWRETGLGAEAHRRTDFPLQGRHALLPCEECHGDRRDRAFGRPTGRCIACHELDFGPRATAAGVDHVAAAFPEDCRACHGLWRFSQARWAEHDACFQITVGVHSAVTCRGCHDVTLPTIPPGGVLACSGDTANCLRCHAMPGIQTAHASVAGFQPANRRCYECHRFSGGGG